MKNFTQKYRRGGANVKYPYHSPLLSESLHLKNTPRNTASFNERYQNLYNKKNHALYLKKLASFYKKQQLNNSQRTKNVKNPNFPNVSSSSSSSVAAAAVSPLYAKPYGSISRKIVPVKSVQATTKKNYAALLKKLKKK